MISLTTIILVAIVVCLSMVIRSVDILRFHAFGVDTFANLLYAKGLENGSFLLKSGKVVYPPLLPQLLHYLRGSLPARTLHLVPKLFDVFTSVAVFLFTLWLLGNEFVAFLALLVYTFSPINIINGYGISTRNIGLFFFVSAIFASYVAMFDIQVKYVMLVLAVASSLLMMMTSRIAYKSYFLLAIALAVLLPLNSSFGILLLVSSISLFLCLLLTRGRFIYQLKEHVFLINFFRKREQKEKSLIRQIGLVFYYDLSWLVGMLAIIDDVDLFLATWLVVIVALSFLWPWGEGERHIAFGIAPASILAASYLAPRLFLMIPLLLVEISIIIRLSLRVLRKRVLVSVDQPLLTLFNEIKQIGDDPLFLCLPPVYSAPLAYFSEKKVLYGESSSEEGVLFQAEVLDAINTTNGLEELTRKYSVTHLFVDKNRFRLKVSPNRWKSIIRQEQFDVLRRKGMREK